MRYEFQYTFEEYRDANPAHFSPRSRGHIILISSAFLLAIAGLLFIALGPVPVASGPASTAPMSLGESAGSLMPYFVLIVFVFVAIVVFGAKTNPKQRRFDIVSSSGLLRIPAQMYLVIIVTLSVLAITISNTRQSASAGQGNPWLTYLPVAMAIGFIWIFVLKRAYRKNWKLQPALLRLRTLEFSPQSVTAADDLVTSIYKWDAFIRCVEAKTLFLLYPSGLNFMIVPKRIFHSQEELESFRNLIIDWSQAKSVGFPVITNNQTM